MKIAVNKNIGTVSRMRGHSARVDVWMMSIKP
jgi:hypothetical protein